MERQPAWCHETVDRHSIQRQTVIWQTTKYTKYAKGDTGFVKIIYSEESYRIMGSCFEVYKEKGSGFLEAVYQECLAYEFADGEVPYRSRPSVTLSYKGRALQHWYQPDFICFEKIIVELKALDALTAVHRAQVHNYLRATGIRLGLLVNFGHFPGVEYERIVV
jgi:GxxExxY protein